MPDRLPQTTTEVQEGGGWEALASGSFLLCKSLQPHPHTQVCLPLLSISDGWLGSTPSKLGYTQLRALNQVQVSVSLEITFPAVSSLVLEPHLSLLSLPPVPACSDSLPSPHPSPIFYTGLSVTLAFTALYHRALRSSLTSFLPPHFDKNALT